MLAHRLESDNREHTRENRHSSGQVEDDVPFTTPSLKYLENGTRGAAFPFAV